MRHSAAPVVEAQEQPAPALMAGGVQMQGVSVPHGGLQGRGAALVQASQPMQEAVAERGLSAVGESDAAAGEALSDLAPLAQPVVALQADPDDEVEFETLSGRRQGGQLRAAAGRSRGAARAAQQEFAGPESAGGEGGQDAGAALASPQRAAARGPVALLGREVELRQIEQALQSTGDAIGRPTRGCGVLLEFAQQDAGPLFGRPSGGRIGRARRGCGTARWAGSGLAGGAPAGLGRPRGGG